VSAITPIPKLIHYIVPADSLAVIILILFLEVHTPHITLLSGLKAIDWLGAFSIGAATVMFLLGLQLGGVQYPWTSPIVISLLTAGVLTFILFFTAQFKLSPSPIMPFRIFSSFSNLSALLVCFFDAFVFNSVAYFIPLYFQIILSASPLQSGIWMLALAVPLSIFSASAGCIMEKTGRYLELLRGGLLLMTVASGLFIDYKPYISWPRIIGFLAIMGIGFGPNFHAPLIALQSKLQPHDVAAGTATFGFIRMLSGTLGIAIGQVVFQSQMQRHAHWLQALDIPSTAMEGFSRGSVIATITPTNAATAYAVRIAKTDALSKMWILYTAMSFAGLLASLGITKQVLSSSRTEQQESPDIRSATPIWPCKSPPKVEIYESPSASAWSTSLLESLGVKHMAARELD
jgi:hypothetical protein